MAIDLDELERIGKAFSDSIVDRRFADIREAHHMLVAARDNWLPMIAELRRLQKVTEQYSPKCDLCGVCGIADEFTERPVPHPTEVTCPKCGEKIDDFSLSDEWFCNCGESGILQDDDEDEE